MVIDPAKREARKISELKRKYEKEGYRVTLYPEAMDLPPFLRGKKYRPDLVAIRGDEKLLIEVKTSAERSSWADFVSAASEIGEHSEWKTIFVLTNPKDPSAAISAAKIPDPDRLSGMLRECQYITLHQDLDNLIDAAVLLVAATAFGVLRFAVYRDFGKTASASPFDAARDAVSRGLITQEEFEKVRSLLEARNAITHGRRGQISKDILQKVLACIGPILQSSGEETDNCA